MSPHTPKKGARMPKRLPSLPLAYKRRTVRVPKQLQRRPIETTAPRVVISYRIDPAVHADLKRLCGEGKPYLNASHCIEQAARILISYHRKQGHIE